MYEFLYSSLLYNFFYAIEFLLYEKYGMLHLLPKDKTAMVANGYSK